MSRKRSASASAAGDGYGVWRDDELPAHRPYAEVIQERLSLAKAVVVIWSADAADQSGYGRRPTRPRPADADPAELDAGAPPMPFDRIQCAELWDWAGHAMRRAGASWPPACRALAGAPPGDKPAARRSRRPLSVCVLPFANMSGDPEQEYFSDGISEDITTDLSKVSALGVVARNTAFTFKGRSVNVREISGQLGVSHVLEGSVRKAGGRVSINAQLIDGETGEHVWADRYDRDLDDIFAIQDEISKAIVAALKLKLMPAEKKAIEQRGTTNAEAYNLYLLARQYWVTGNQGDPRREERVMRICSKAVEIDPYYAQAWALLAIAQSNLRYGFGQQVDDGYAAAHTALAIDPSIAEAHCAMARRLEEQGGTTRLWPSSKRASASTRKSWELNKAIANFLIYRGRIAERRGISNRPRRHGHRLSRMGNADELLPRAGRRGARQRGGQDHARAGRKGPRAGPEQRRGDQLRGQRARGDG